MDNLRRSLVALSIFALLVTGWLFLPGSKLTWTLIPLSPFIVPILTGFVSELRRNFSEEYPQFETRSIRLTAMRSFFEILFLPHEAFVHLDAIATTINRLYVTHRRMLQRMTAAHSVRLFGKTLQVKSAWQAMVITPLFTVALGLIILLQEPNVMAVAALFLIGWVFSPTIAAHISIPDDPVLLQTLDKAIMATCEEAADWQKVKFSREWIQPSEAGGRPENLADRRAHPVVQTAIDVLKYLDVSLPAGREAIASGATDGNVAVLMGVPSVSIGAANGGGGHTLQEWARIDTARTGVQQVVLLAVSLAEMGQ